LRQDCLPADVEPEVTAVPTARSSGLVGLFGKVGSLNVAVLTNARILKTV
jgi:hypothetical protein